MKPTHRRKCPPSGSTFGSHWAGLICAALVASCSETPRIETPFDEPQNAAPMPLLTASAYEGPMPLSVALDASATMDENLPDDELSFRFDIDGDGTYESDFAPSPTVDTVYFRAGTFSPTVEVRDREGLTAVASLAMPIQVLLSLDIDADSNRDGLIDDSDDIFEDTFDEAHGAVIPANVDDDDADGVQDGSDSRFNGDFDRNEFAELIIQQYPALDPAHTVNVVVDEAARSNVRLFRDVGALPILAHDLGGTGRVDIPSADLISGAVRLLVESPGRVSGFTGDVVVTVREEGGDQIREDSVRLRVAPVIFPDNLLRAQRLYVMQITDWRFWSNEPFFDSLQRNLPSSVQLHAADQYEYFGDRWMQDNMQTGYQESPVQGGRRILPTYLETDRPTGREGLEFFLRQENFEADRGWIYAGRSWDTSLSYGGNLEIAPPHESADGVFPFGRILTGGGSGGTLLGIPYEDRMSGPQRALLEAQLVQAPAVELSTEWLAVGHLDEVFLFVPFPNHGPDERAFKVVIGSPMLAFQLLEQMAGQDEGSAVLFQGRETQTTVRDLLDDEEFAFFNRAAQARIDSVRDVLKGRLNLVDSDFVELPVLQENLLFDGYDLAAAFSPGMQNLVVADTTLFVPDPEGPQSNGVDVFRESARTALESLGNTVFFVDVFDSYHLQLGEAHCGTEVEHEPYEQSWWEVSQ